MSTKNINPFLDTKSVIKAFSFRNKTFFEKVAKYPKIKYLEQISQRPDEFKQMNLYPQGKDNIFTLRIDADEVHTDDFKEYIEIFRDYSPWITLFCSARAFEKNKKLLEETKEANIDIQSHGYYHYVYNDYESNLFNLSKAKYFFEELKIITSGFAAPMGKYNNNLMLALEELGYKYSSDFSFDYLNFPHYPYLGKRFSKILQVPIFPICPEILFAAGLSIDEVIAYFNEVVKNLTIMNIPIIIYAHTNKTYPQVKIFLKEFLERIKDNSVLHKCNMTDFSSWCFSVEDASFSSQYGLLVPEASAALRQPQEDLLGAEVTENFTKKIKSFIKEMIDYEDVTPLEELRGNLFRKGLKSLYRRYKIKRQ